MPPALQPDPDAVAQRRQEICETGIPHPVAQIQRVAAIDQQGVGFADPLDPAV